MTRPWYRSWKWLVLIPPMVLVTLLVQWLLARPSEADSIPVLLGSNVLELDKGDYEIWIETDARPEVLPNPSAFDFELRATGEGSGTVDPVVVSAGLTAAEPGRSIWRLAEVEIRTGGEFVLTGEQVDEAPPGDLLLLEG